MEKVLQFTNGIDRYLSLADKKVQEGDLFGALGFLYAAESKGGAPDVWQDIADVFSEMGLYELSNRYWFKYLSAVPKEKSGIALEELAINYFYMENLFVSSYYFHRKVLIDGYISQDGLGEDIIDFFSDNFNLKKQFRIVYPFDKADYSNELSGAKRALCNGDYRTAIKLYSSIPEGCRQFKEASNELSVVYFLTGEVDKAIDISRKALETEGKSTSILCNLSSMYKYKKNDDKSAYYYREAKSIFDGDKEGLYKLATCSLEQGDTESAIEYLEKVCKDRPYDQNMNYLYALALANARKMDLALSVMKKALLVTPDNVVIKYYVDLFSSILDGQVFDDLFPLEYISDLPQKERQKRSRKIDALFVMETGKVIDKLNDQKVLDTVLWGLEHAGEKTAKKCVFILTQINTPKANAVLREKLIDTEISDEVKRAILYVWIMIGNLKKINVQIRGFFMEIKPRELPCKKDPDGMLFYSAYALCLSRLIFSESSEFDKIAFATDKVYKKLKDKQNLIRMEKETVASLIVSLSKLDKIKSDKDICSLFSANYKDYILLKTEYEGEKND